MAITKKLIRAGNVECIGDEIFFFTFVNVSIAVYSFWVDIFYQTVFSTTEVFNVNDELDAHKIQLI